MKLLLKTTKNFDELMQKFCDEINKKGMGLSSSMEKCSDGYFVVIEYAGENRVMNHALKARISAKMKKHDDRIEVKIIKGEKDGD